MAAHARIHCALVFRANLPGSLNVFPLPAARTRVDFRVLVRRSVQGVVLGSSLHGGGYSAGTYPLWIRPAAGRCRLPAHQVATAREEPSNRTSWTIHTPEPHRLGRYKILTVSHLITVSAFSASIISGGWHQTLRDTSPQAWALSAGILPFGWARASAIDNAAGITKRPERLHLPLAIRSLTLAGSYFRISGLKPTIVVS